MEGTTGLEPATNSLKGCLLDDFAFVPDGMRGKIRTFIGLFLRQAPLPAGLRVLIDFGILDLDIGFEEQFEPSHLEASFQSKIQNLKSKMDLASGKVFEPLFTGSEPAVLPVRRPRKES